MNHPAYLVASGDLRLSANQTCWPAQEDIGASYGDAFLAGIAAGRLQRSDLARWVRPGFEVRPNLGRKGTYDYLYADYRLLYERTREIVHRLGEK